MKFLFLIGRNLLRKKIRTGFTFLSILVAFLLFGLLGAIRTAFSQGVEVAGVDRLVLIHKVSLIQLLPISYLPRIAAIPGVTDIVYLTWFGGIYQDPKNFFPQMPADPERFFRIYTELVVPEEQKKAWLADRTGALVGRNLIERFGWKLGDRIPLRSPIWQKKDGSNTWEFTIAGIYDAGKKGVDTSGFFFHYDYFDEARAFGQGLVGWYVIRINDPANAAKIAGQIDAEFANSPYETKTTTEKAFGQAFANQVGNIGAIVTAVLSAVFFTILLVTGNTMAQSVRERTSEWAVLKTLGFTNGLVLRLVLTEAFLLALTGGVLGLLLAWGFVRQGDPTGGFLPVFYIPGRYFLYAGVTMILLGLASGILPAVRAMRLRIADALRRAEA